MVFLPDAVRAEIKIIDAESTYVMGDNDSKLDARRISIQEAKRNALELAGTYVASLTEVKEFRLTKDEVTAYTAGIVETEVIAEEMHGSAERPEMFTRVRCRIDTSVLAHQIANYRENDDLKAQAEATARENAALKQERDRLLALLQSEKDRTKTGETKKQLDSVLSREESNAEVGKLWRRLAYRLGTGREISKQEQSEATSALKAHLAADPRNTRAHLLLAMIYHNNGDLAAAEREAREGLVQAPDSPQLRLKLGAVLKERKKYDEALEELQKVEMVMPGNPNLLFHIGMIHAANDTCGKATSYLRKFISKAKHADPPISERKKQRAIKAIKYCERGELEPRRRR
ncbi:MAG: tetratricopeptide repeat protein [Nitrospirota bacterium]